MLISVHRPSGGHLDPTSCKTLEVDSPRQWAIQARGRNLQQVRTPGDRVLYVEDDSHLAAQVGAVFVRHPARLVNRNAQHPALASATHLDFDYLESTGSGDTL